MAVYSPAPTPLTCNYCGSCKNGVYVPPKVDEGCPPNNMACNSISQSACESSGGLSPGVIAGIIIAFLVFLGILLYMTKGQF